MIRLQRFLSLPNSFRLAFFVLQALACATLLTGCTRFGAEPSSPFASPSQGQTGEYREVSLADSKKSGRILAQGRIQPARGIIRISAIPGDRIEEVLVKPGQRIRKNEPLLVMQSFQLKTLELETARLKLVEARSSLDAKRQEADLTVDAAKLKLESTQKILSQALSQLKLAQKGNDQIESLQMQIASLQELRNSPLTRAAIGTIEIETKKNELLRMTTLSEQSLLAAEQAVELSRLQVSQAEKLLVSAIEGRGLVDRMSPVASLEKQIELLELQLEQSRLISPIDGVILSVNAEPGERASQMPLMELSNLADMVCVAEVHEADVGRIAIDDLVELRSAALSKTLSGRVQRIDRVVGAVQLRFPNPMARADFRAVPVWISIDPSDAEAASNRLQLQVDVSIAIAR
jgi:HlyD family secretion protein